MTSICHPVHAVGHERVTVAGEEIVLLFHIHLHGSRHCIVPRIGHSCHRMLLRYPARMAVSWEAALFHHQLSVSPITLLPNLCCLTIPNHTKPHSLLFYKNVKREFKTTLYSQVVRFPCPCFTLGFYLCDQICYHEVSNATSGRIP